MRLDFIIILFKLDKNLFYIEMLQLLKIKMKNLPSIMNYNKI